MINGNGSPHGVLIVEDDQLLMALTAGIVEDAGFEAIQAGNADQAVAILKARSDIALLLTDVDMPGSMDGVKLAHAVRDRWPRSRSSWYPAAFRTAICRQAAAFSASLTTQAP